MVLAAARPGKAVRIQAINAGRGLQARLAALGMTPGVEVEVIAGGASGPCIVALRNSRIALGRGMAGKIIVG